MLGVIWQSWPAPLRDWLLLLALMAPVLCTGVVLLRGFAVGPVLRALLWRNRWTNALLAGLIALSVGVGVGLTAQERAIRAGTAQAAQAFDVIIAAPGSEITVMLAAVYLQPTDLPLLDGPTYARIAEHPRVSLAAPIAFGDSYEGVPVVGVTAEFIAHMAGPLIEGDMFTRLDHAVAGARAPVQPGDRFVPAHGIGSSADAEAHGTFQYTVVGRMPPTGSPWDRALLVPVESVWDVHGLAPGHGPEWDGTPGPPFDPRFFPGTPAVLVVPDSLSSAYVLRGAFSDTETMAFFPGAVLNRLHGLMGNVRQAMSVMALLTQVLVVGAALGALALLARLLAPRFALLRALGAPGRFVLALMWSYACVLILGGAAMGLTLGIATAAGLSSLLSAQTDIGMAAQIGWPEVHMVALFVCVASTLALLPALLALGRPITADLRR